MLIWSDENPLFFPSVLYFLLSELHLSTICLYCPSNRLLWCTSSRDRASAWFHHCLWRPFTSTRVLLQLMFSTIVFRRTVQKSVLILSGLLAFPASTVSKSVVHLGLKTWTKRDTLHYEEIGDLYLNLTVHFLIWRSEGHKCRRRWGIGNVCEILPSWATWRWSQVTTIIWNDGKYLPTIRSHIKEDSDLRG